MKTKLAFCGKIIVISILAFMTFKTGYSQDIIVKKKGDTVFCKITNVDANKIMLDIKKDGRKISTFISKEDITDFKYGFISKATAQSNQNKSKTAFGITAGIATGKFTGMFVDESVSRTGFSTGVLIIFPSSSIIRITTGANLDYLFSKTVTESGSLGGQITTDYQGGIIYSLFAGPKIGKEKGAYFLPSVSANNTGDGIRFGFDIGGGLPLSTSKSESNLFLGAKYSFVNLIGKKEGEVSEGIFRIFLGLVF